ncbi:hypothetical protein ZWY2020_001617 [Hordeum vulgare]|nr:hypothetical protein ZWY2020_001617 [Hordeum vulgare]
MLIGTSHGVALCGLHCLRVWIGRDNGMPTDGGDLLGLAMLMPPTRSGTFLLTSTVFLFFSASRSAEDRDRRSRRRKAAPSSLRRHAAGRRSPWAGAG